MPYAFNNQILRKETSHLLDDKSGKGAVAEDLCCHLLYLIGRKGIYLCKQATNIFIAAIIEKTIDEI